MPKLDKRSPACLSPIFKRADKKRSRTESFGRDCAGRAGSPAQATRLRFLKCMRSRRALEIQHALDNRSNSLGLVAPRLRVSCWGKPGTPDFSGGFGVHRHQFAEWTPSADLKNRGGNLAMTPP